MHGTFVSSDNYTAAGGAGELRFMLSQLLCDFGKSTIHFRLELSPGEPCREEGLATFYRDKEAAGSGKLRKEQLSIYID